MEGILKIMIELLGISCIICIICRCIIFNRRDIAWQKALIPGYNKLIIGKLAGVPRVSIIVAVSQFLSVGLYIFSVLYDMWIINTYSSDLHIPYDENIDSYIDLTVPSKVANISNYSKYILIITLLFTMIVWCILMWNFTIKQCKSPWWVILWLIAPVIPYIYFALSSKIISFDGKKYTLKRVELNE